MKNLSTQTGSGLPVSDKDKTTTLILAALLGGLGIDRFYTGSFGKGLLKLITFSGFGIWYIIDILLIASGRYRDGNGRPLADTTSYIYQYQQHNKPGVQRLQGMNFLVRLSKDRFRTLHKIKNALKDLGASKVAVNDNIITANMPLKSTMPALLNPLKQRGVGCRAEIDTRNPGASKVSLRMDAAGHIAQIGALTATSAGLSFLIMLSEGFKYASPFGEYFAGFMFLSAILYWPVRNARLKKTRKELETVFEGISQELAPVGRQRFTASPKPDNIETVILKNAKANKGYTTPAQVALDGDISLDEAKECLEALVNKGFAEMRVRDNGSLVYAFPDFMDDTSKDGFSV
ncbi:MAG: TM2 domain-containing protein [Spirochaetia bacterium]